MESSVIFVNINFLKSYLKDQKLSEKEFAESIGVAHSTVNRVLNGKRNPGGKFVSGVLNNYPQLSFEEVFQYTHSLPKGNNKQIV